MDEPLFFERFLSFLRMRESGAAAIVVGFVQKNEASVGLILIIHFWNRLFFVGLEFLNFSW